MLPILREQRSGHTFQVSSIGGPLANVGLSPYQSVNCAVGGFSTSLAQAVTPLGLKVTIWSRARWPPIGSDRP